MALFAFGPLVTGPAVADGGRGGGSIICGGFNAGGSGGAGYAGAAGSGGGGCAAGAAGGGGGAAGGGTGGAGSNGGTSNGGGAGGTSGSPTGAAGADGFTAAGGGGGYGGANGNGSGAATINNSSPLSGQGGGNGGDGGSGATSGGGGGGGSGGYGAVVTGATANTNNNTISGGNGGNGGNAGGGGGGFGGSGGDGGVGVQFTTTGATFTNSGTVTGGNGGTAGSGGGTNTASGGAGIVGSGLTVINSGTISGGLGGDGTTRADAITFTSGANTLTINGGSLTGNISVNGSGSLTFNQATAQTFGNVITGNGSVIQNGAGTLTLSGANTYTGGTTISAGVLSVSADSNLGPSASNVTLNGGTLEVTGLVTTPRSFALNATSTIQVDTGASLTISGGSQLINGSGGAGTLIKTGAGTLNIFTGSPASNTGGVVLMDGTLYISDVNRIGAATGTTTVNGGTLNFVGGNQTQAALIQNGGTVQGSGQTFAVGTYQLTGGTLAANATVSASTAFDMQAGAVSGILAGAGALTKTTTGIVTLSGVNTYAGATTINAGTLSVNGSIATSSAVTVNSGGILGGTGTVATTTINSGGALAPGNSIGTIAVNGPLTFNAWSGYNVEVSPTAADRTNVTGAATLTGATVNATYAAGSYVARQYTILNATTGTIGGANVFAGLANTNLPGNVSAALGYDANNVYLNLTLNFATPSGGLNVNQQNVANTLTNYFNTTGGIPGAFAALSSNGLSQASGQPGVGVQQSGFQASGQFVNAIVDNAFDDSSGQSGGTPLGYAPQRKVSREAAQAYAAVTPKDRAASFDRRWNVWASAYGGNSRISGDAGVGSNTTTSRIFGVVAGAGYRVSPDTQIGFALGGAGTNFSLDGGFGSGKADVFNAAIYGKHMIGAAYVAGLVGYAWQDTTTDRTVTIAGTDQLRASFRAQALTARLEGGWRYAMPFAGVTPYAALQGTTFYLPSYGETATSGSNQFALSYASKTVTATRGELGARFDRASLVQGGVLTLKAKTAWAHDWNTDRAATASFQALPGTSFTVNGAKPSANAALLSLGAEMAWHNGWSFAANADGEFSRTTTGYAGKGTLRYVW